jgi:hypothetical protein
MGRQEIKHFRPPENSVLISISDPGHQPPDLDREFYIERYSDNFWDLDKTIVMNAFNDEPGIWGDNNKEERILEPATLDQLKAIRTFIRKHWDKNIFVNCEAGVSRSAAIREYLSFHGWDYFEENWTRQIVPNNYILRMLKRMDFEKWA